MNTIGFCKTPHIIDIFYYVNRFYMNSCEEMPLAYSNCSYTRQRFPTCPARLILLEPTTKVLKKGFIVALVTKVKMEIEKVEC